MRERGRPDVDAVAAMTEPSEALHVQARPTREIEDPRGPSVEQRVVNPRDLANNPGEATAGRVVGLVEVHRQHPLAEPRLVPRDVATRGRPRDHLFGFAPLLGLVLGPELEFDFELPLPGF